MYRKLSYHILTIKQSSQESLRSYVQRFNTESLKVDILDEKFAITAFIAGLGMQSKDLMFSISKKPSYPNKRALPLKRKRTRATRNGNETPRDKQTGTNPQGGVEKTGSDSQEGEGTSETA